MLRELVALDCGFEIAAHRIERRSFLRPFVLEKQNVVTELALDGTPATLSAAIVRGWQVEHACGAPPLALRVELGGVSFAYSGDTQWTPALTEAARGADLFAVEAYTFDRPIRYHLNYQTLRAHLPQIHAERVVLTHMSATMLSRLADAELPAAYDGMVIDL